MRKLKFIELDPLEIARQLTIKDAALFSKITIQECLGKAWPKQFGSDAPNISTMIDLSNAVSTSLLAGLALCGPPTNSPALQDNALGHRVDSGR